MDMIPGALRNSESREPSSCLGTSVGLWLPSLSAYHSRLVLLTRSHSLTHDQSSLWLLSVQFVATRTESQRVGEFPQCLATAKITAANQLHDVSVHQLIINDGPGVSLGCGSGRLWGYFSAGRTLNPTAPGPHLL